jgi:hypothetical protein
MALALLGADAARLGTGLDQASQLGAIRIRQAGQSAAGRVADVSAVEAEPDARTSSPTVGSARHASAQAVHA